MKSTEKELLKFVSVFDKLFSGKAENSSYKWCEITKPQWLKDQEETQQRIMNQENWAKHSKEFKRGGEMDMFLHKTVKHKNNKITEQEIDKKAKELSYVKNMQDLGLRDTRFPSLEGVVRPYTFELPLTFKEFDTYYTLTKDIVGLDKTKLTNKVEGLKYIINYDNLLDKRRTKFNYTFELPEISDLESIYITYIDGCLTITVPKLARKIKHYTVQ